MDAANAIDRLAYQAQGHCRDAKHAESVADELRRLLKKEKERADKFMWQVRDTCTRAEKAEAHIRAIAAENEALRRENAYLTSIPEADRQAENVVAEYSKLHERTRAAESLVAELRAENERLRKAFEPVIEIAARNESSPVILRARSELEAGHE